MSLWESFWHPFREKLGPFWGVEINVFTVQDPSKNGAKSLQKKTLQPDPPKILNFQPQDCFWCSRPPQKEPFWRPFRFMLPSRGALRLKIEEFGGVWLQSPFVEEILHHFWRGPGQWKRWFRLGGVAQITISPKSEFYYFLSPFWGSFWSQHLSKMALGLAMGRPG